jgi:hypothetical protein
MIEWVDIHGAGWDGTESARADSRSVGARHGEGNLGLEFMVRAFHVNQSRQTEHERRTVDLGVWLFADVSRATHTVDRY